MDKVNVTTKLKRGISILLCFLITILFIIGVWSLLNPYFYYQPNANDIFQLIIICIIYMTVILFFILWNKLKTILIYILPIVSMVSILVMIEPYQRNLETRGRIFIVLPIGFAGQFNIIEDRKNHQSPEARALESFGVHQYELEDGQNEIRVRNIRIFKVLPISFGNDGFFPEVNKKWENNNSLNIMVR